MANWYVITPGYIQAMQTKLVGGRDIDARDTKDKPLVVLVNEAFARQLLPGEDAVGKRFRQGTKGPWIQIAGVVEDGKYRSLGETPSPTVFQDMDQSWRSNLTLVARSPLPEAETARLLQRAVGELDPSLTIYESGSLTSRLALALFPARLVAVVLASFGLLAVVLAATGVYGIMAYAVSRRTREIGIRMALGAAPAQVLRVVLLRTAVLLGIGTVLGLAMALAGGQFFAQILYGVSARDPLTYFCAIALMAAVAFVACLVPARRAIKIDPLTALRTE
jgi:predicted permease